MINNSSKVFCVDCAYFNTCKRSNARVSFDDGNLHETCNAPQNIRSNYMSDGSDKYISAPTIINKYNNCKWFAGKSKPSDIIALIDAHNRDAKSHPYLLSKIDETANKAAEDTIRVQYNLDTEVERAITAENTISGSVTALAQKEATDIENLSSKDAALDTKINNEVIRATTAEAVINTVTTSLQVGLAAANQNISNNSTAINNEITRARSAESTLQSNIQGAIVECKQYATDQDNSVKNFAISKAAEERENAVGLSKQYTNEVKATLEREIDEKTRSLWHYKGKVNYRRDLDNITQKTEGDIYTVLYRDDGTAWNSEFIWTADGKWEELGSLIDLRDYYKKAEVDALINGERTYVNVEFRNLVNQDITTAKNSAIATATQNAEDKDAARYIVITNDIATAKTAAITAATQNAEDKDAARYITVTEDIAESKQEAIDASTIIAEDKDAARYTTITNDIATAKTAAITAAGLEADTKDSSYYTNVTKPAIDQSLADSKTYTDGKINDVKNTYLPLAGNKVVTGIVEFDSTIKVKDSELSADTLTIKSGSFIKSSNATNTTVTINLPQYSGTLARTADVDSAVGAISETVNEHILNDTNAHDIDTRLTQTLTSAETKAAQLDSTQYTTITNETDAKVNNIKNTYLPLEGNKVVTNVVEFDGTIKVKDTTLGANTLVVGSTSFTKKSSVEGVSDVVISLPSASGTLASISDVTSLKETVDSNTARIVTIEGKIPTSITSTIPSTSVSEGKDVPNNYAVKNALATKAGIQDLEDGLATKANVSTTYTKTQVDNLIAPLAKQSDVNTALDTKANKTVVDGIQNTMATKDTTYTRSYLDPILNAAATKNYVDTEVAKKATIGTSLSDYGITDAYTKTQVDSLVAGTYRVKPSVETYEDLPLTGNKTGDVRNVRSGTYAGANFVWIDDVTKWDKLSETVDLSGKQDVITAVKHPQNTKVGSSANPVYIAENGNAEAVIVDKSVTQNSENTITSGAVYTALQTKVSTSQHTIDLATKANIDSVYTKEDVYTQSETNTLVGKKIDTDVANATFRRIDDSYSSAQINTFLAAKANSADVARDYATKEENNETYTSCIAYTDQKIAEIDKHHYWIRDIVEETEYPNCYKLFDYSTNNIDLTGKTGNVYIYLPATTSALTGKSRELIVNVFNRNTETCTVNFASLNSESVTFKDGGMLETLKTEKEEFSIKFQEYQISKYLVDEVGKGDTTNNSKIAITNDQMTLVDGSGTSYKLVIEDGQLKLRALTLS